MKILVTTVEEKPLYSGSWYAVVTDQGVIIALCRYKDEADYVCAIVQCRKVEMVQVVGD